jgi:hypothetical protein
MSRRRVGYARPPCRHRRLSSAGARAGAPPSPLRVHPGTLHPKSYPVELGDVEAAARRIAPHVHRTPILRSSTIDARAGCQVYFKCESLQRAGCFKVRGAVNALFSLSDAEAARGVVTQSSGNHGMAVALAAQLRGVEAHVVVPQNTPSCKVAAIEGYGATLTYSGNSMAEREARAAEVQAETGAVAVHPYNDAAVMAGQGTIALEMLEQLAEQDCGPPDAILVPVSGGGMISGIAVVPHDGVMPACVREPRALRGCSARRVSRQPRASGRTSRSLLRSRPARTSSQTSLCRWRRWGRRFVCSVLI